MNKWIVLELTPKGEEEDPQVIESSITRIVKGAKVYVPALESCVGDDRIVHFLMRGYAFVLKDRPDKDYYRLEETRNIQSILRSTDGRGLATVDNTHIEGMREKLRAEVNQGISVGDLVRICSGPYKNLDATVITDIPEKKSVQVFVQLRSKQSILTLPRSVLQVLDRDPLNAFNVRFKYLSRWYQEFRVLQGYSQPIDPLFEKCCEYEYLLHTISRLAILFTVHPSYEAWLAQSLESLNAKVDELERIDGWLSKGRSLYSYVFFDSLLPEKSLRTLCSKVIQLAWVQDIEYRSRKLSQGIENLARAIESSLKDEGSVVEDILVDGYNLYFRCLYAPNIMSLRDSKGRHTGVVFGFLRSLGALRKRYPEARLWVAWDGSSQRRKNKYADYKANRDRSSSVGERVFDALGTLKEILPKVGVIQAINPEEEADDVIATLVRGELSGHSVLMYSTDRDLLQVVNDSARLLVPSVGSRKEILFDVKATKSIMGVPPKQVVQLRAFYGDPSDNLPGVPRVPKKVLKALVSEYGSVDGVYDSGLSGVSKGQYERLMSAEPQVRINADLMTLEKVEVLKTDPDVDIKTAKALLRGLEINPDPIMNSFFGGV